MPSCTVYWCNKRSGTSSLLKDNTTFHKYPQEPRIRAIWVKASGNHVSWTPKRTSTICSQHFEPSCFIAQARNKRKLIKNAIPTLRLSMVSCCTGTDSVPKHCPFKRKKRDTDDDLQPQKTQTQEQTNQQTQECKTATDQFSNHNIYLLNSAHYKKSEETHIKLIKRIQMRNKKIKRLQSQARYLRKEAVRLEQILRIVTET